MFRPLIKERVVQTTTTRAIPDPAAEPTISVKRAAAILGISVRHAYVAVERDEIPSIQVGQRIVIPTIRFLTKYGLLDATSATAPTAR